MLIFGREAIGIGSHRGSAPGFDPQAAAHMGDREHAVQGMTGFCCSVCDPQGLRSFPSSKALQHHTRTAHQLTLCTTCLEVLPPSSRPSIHSSAVEQSVLIAVCLIPPG